MEHDPDYDPDIRGRKRSGADLSRSRLGGWTALRCGVLACGGDAGDSGVEETGRSLDKMYIETLAHAVERAFRTCT